MHDELAKAKRDFVLYRNREYSERYLALLMRHGHIANVEQAFQRNGIEEHRSVRRKLVAYIHIENARKYTPPKESYVKISEGYIFNDGALYFFDKDKPEITLITCAPGESSGYTIFTTEYLEGRRWKLKRKTGFSTKYMRDRYPQLIRDYLAALKVSAINEIIKEINLEEKALRKKTESLMEKIEKL